MTRYGSWTVIGPGGRTPHRKKMLECRCDCGAVKMVRETDMKSGRSKGCVDCYLRPSFDEVSVESLVSGHRLNGRLWRERREAARIILARRPDWSCAEVARYVGVSSKTVERVKKEHSE